MAKKQKFVSLADIISDYEKNPEFMKTINKLKQRQKESPARHNRQFSLKLMEYGTKVQCAAMNVALITQDINRNGSRWSKEDLDLAWAHRKEQAQMMIDAQNEYDAEVAILDQAIIDEDLAKSL